MLLVLLHPAAELLLQSSCCSMQSMSHVQQQTAITGTGLQCSALPHSRARHDLITKLPVQALNPEMSNESLTNIMTHQFVGSGRRQLHALREDWTDFRGGTLPGCTSSCGYGHSCRGARVAHPAADGEQGL